MPMRSCRLSRRTPPCAPSGLSSTMGNNMEECWIAGIIVESTIVRTIERDNKLCPGQDSCLANATILVALILLCLMSSCHFHNCCALCPHILRIPQTTPRTPNRRAMLDEWAYRLRSYQCQVFRAVSTPRPQFVTRFAFTFLAFSEFQTLPIRMEGVYINVGEG